MAYKFQFGAARMSGSLLQEEGVTTTDLNATGDVDLGNATSDTVTVTGRFDSDLVPSTDSARDLGTSALQWAEAHIDAGYIDGLTVTGTSTLTTVDINGGNIDGTAIGAVAVAAGSFAAVVGTTGVYSGILKTDDTTEATSATDGSLQTDGGLSVAKSAVIGDDLDLLSDGAIINIGSTSKFTLTDQGSNNTVMATAAHRLAFGNAGEYISGDGTDLDIISSGDLDITATLVDITGALTVSGLTTATGRVVVDDATEATSTTDGSLQTDGGLSVAKSAVIGDDLDLLSDSAILNFGLNQDVNLTHVADAGLLLNTGMYLSFRDADLKIASSADGFLDISANTKINMSGAVGITGTVVCAGALGVAGTATFNGDIDLGNATSDTITPTDFALCSGGNGTTVTLPTAVAGKSIYVKLSASVGDQIIAANSNDFIEGTMANIRLESTGSAVLFVAYNAGTWFLV